LSFIPFVANLKVYFLLLDKKLAIFTYFPRFIHHQVFFYVQEEE